MLTELTEATVLSDKTSCRVMLLPDEISAIRTTLRELTSRYDSVEDTKCQEEVPLYAQELPRRLRKNFREFKHRERYSVLVVSGFPIDQEAVGKTPAHWKHKAGTRAVLEVEMLLALYGALLGDLLAWSTQQHGYLVHDILPIMGHEKEQLGSGSEELLTWHTEDAFHPHCGDYVGMFCIRNGDRIPTMIASIDCLDIPQEHLKVLFEPRFSIRPDESHQQKNRNDPSDLDLVLRQAYEAIKRMNTAPEKIAVLFGDPRSPYMRLDPYFMDPLEDDPEAQQALDALVSQIDEKIGNVALSAGECCFVDNFRAVHGRMPFKARFDGTDRWLKRINVTRDLRRSRSSRESAESPVIF